MPPSKFGVNWPFGSGEEAKNRFSRWRPSWISDRYDFTIFDLQATLMLPSKFRVYCPFSSEKEVENRFSRWRPSHPDASFRVSSQMAQGCRESRLLKQLLTPHDG